MLKENWSPSIQMMEWTQLDQLSTLAREIILFQRKAKAIIPMLTLIYLANSFKCITGEIMKRNENYKRKN